MLPNFKRNTTDLIGLKISRVAEATRFLFHKTSYENLKKPNKKNQNEAIKYKICTLVDKTNCMPTTEELIKQAEELNEERKYDDVIRLLSNVLLKQRKNASLYVERARAYNALTNFESLFQDCKKAMSLAPNYYKTYNYLGNYWMYKDEYDKAIKDYDKALKLNPEYAHAFNNRGIAWYNKDDFDKAIQDYNRAIELNHDYFSAYYNRGIAWNSKGEFYKSIEEDGKSIKSYNNALSDYQKAITLNPYHNEVYGYLADTYNSLADIYYNRQQYDKALEFYEQSLPLEYSIWTKNRIDSIKARLEEEIEKKSDNAASFIIDIIQKVKNQKNKITIRDNSLDVLYYMDRIRKHSQITDPEPVVHYTKLNILDTLLNPNNNMRFYNVLYMNDPQEGKVIFDYLDPDIPDSEKKNNQHSNNGIKECFNSGCILPDGDNNVYLGSFLPAPETVHEKKYSHEDELVLWRTYGKNENNEEAKGCSIVLDGSYFSNESRYMQQSIHNMNAEQGKIFLKGIIYDLKKYPLFRVLYYDKRTNKIMNIEDVDNIELNKDMESLKKALIILVETGKKYNEEEVISLIIYRILSELRYFFKSSDYAYENECRVIIYATPEDSRVKIDEQNSSPKKLYYDPETEIQPYIKKIYIGPRVQNADAWKMYLDVAIKKNKEKPELKNLYGDIQILKSTQKFQ